MYRALYKYTAKEDADSSLSLQEGEQVVVLGNLDEQWVKIQSIIGDEKTGTVPINCLKAEENVRFPLYVARKAVLKDGDAEYATMGEKVKLLHRMANYDWLVQHTESLEIAYVDSGDFLAVTMDDDDDDIGTDGPAAERNLDPNFTSRFVVDRNSIRRNAANRPGLSPSPSPLLGARSPATPRAASPFCATDDSQDNSSPAVERRNSKKKSLRRKLSLRKDRSKNLAEKEERKGILQELDSTIAALKGSKNLRQKSDIKDLLTTMQKLRNDVSRGRDLDKAREFLNKDTDQESKTAGYRPSPLAKEPLTASGSLPSIVMASTSTDLAALPPRKSVAARLSHPSSSSITTTSSTTTTTSTTTTASTSPPSEYDLPDNFIETTTTVPHPQYIPFVPVASSMTQTCNPTATVDSSKGSESAPSGNNTSPHPAKSGVSARAALPSPVNGDVYAAVDKRRSTESCSRVRPTKPSKIQRPTALPPPPPGQAPTPGLTRSAVRLPPSPAPKKALTRSTTVGEVSSTTGPVSGVPQLSHSVSLSAALQKAVRPATSPTIKSKSSSSSLLVRIANQVMSSSSNSQAPKDVARRLVEDLRVKTGSSFDNSCLSAKTVLDHMKDYMPSQESEIENLVEAIDELRTSSEPDGGKDTHDAKRLDVIFAELTTMRNDGQQRNWTVHDDGDIIKEYLEELLSILSDADQAVCSSKIAFDDFAILSTLTEYYQMETRVPIRMLLLKFFGGLCSLDEKIPSVLLNTNLPLELARDIKANTSEFQKTLYSCLVATMMFSTGDKPPVNYYETWNTEFVLFLLDMIENPMEEDEEERLLDCAIGVVLGFNYHFLDIDVANNHVMKALRTTNTTSNFCEKVLLIVNREEDPVAMGKPLVPDSVLKLLKDMFAERSTASLFYTSDVHVLIGIVARQLNDLPEDSELRYHYLLLLEEMVQTTDYNIDLYGKDELATALTRIEEGEVVEARNRETITRIRSLAPSLAAS